LYVNPCKVCTVRDLRIWRTFLNLLNVTYGFAREI
jgi:hypothetical protein